MSGNVANLGRNFLSGMAIGQRATDMRRDGEMRNFLAENGGQVMAGDPAALQTLMGYDPRMAMGIQQRQQAMDMQREQFDYRRGQDARTNERQDAMLQMQLDERVRQMSAAERAAVAQETEQELMRVAALAQQGNWDAVNQILRESGVNATVSDLPGLTAAVAPFKAVYETVMRANPMEELSERQRKIQDTMANNPGMDLRTAQGIVDGQIDVITDPVLGESSQIDIARGTTRPLQPVQGQQPTAPQGSPQTQAGQPPGLGFGPDVPTGGNNAFGLRGLGAGLLNSAADFAGINQPFPGIAEHQRFFRALEEDGLVSIVQRYPRMPARDMVERLRRLLPNVGTLEGAQQAQGEMVQLRDRFLADAARLEDSMQRRMKPQDREAIRRQVSDFQRIAGQLDEGVRRLSGESAQGQNKTSGGVTWEIVE